ncbi:MAG TPA: hypothetical protein VK031_00355, partial [Tissierellaceae bacterium]|nr:hypothetical protein [Tissierellaceae bacterium]
IFKPEKENRVYNILDSLRRVKYKLSNQNRKIPGEVKKGQYLYFVESGIYRFDTFKNEHTEEAKKNTQYYYARETTDDPLPQSIYDQFITFGYDSHTFAGQTLQGIFGRNKSHYNKFDRKHRVKVKLYNLNYFVYASVGIKVKMHKRGWTGIWHTVKANEIRLGWDGLIVDIEIPYAPALPHSMQINANTTKLGTITFLSKNFSIAGVSINNDLVNKALNGALKSGFKSAVGTIWDYVRKSVAPSQYETEENEVRAFRAIYPNKARIVFDRYEESKKNVKKIVEVFDTNVGIKFTWDGSGLPNPSPNTYKYTLVGGSVYGAAKYNGTWKGVRVKKY